MRTQQMQNSDQISTELIQTKYILNILNPKLIIAKLSLLDSLVNYGQTDRTTEPKTWVDVELSHLHGGSPNNVLIQVSRYVRRLTIKESLKIISHVINKHGMDNTLLFPVADQHNNKKRWDQSEYCDQDWQQHRLHNYPDMCWSGWKPRNDLW